MYASRLIGRSAKHNFATPGYLSRNSQHQHSRKKRSSATGHIQAHLFDADGFLPARNTRHRFHLLTHKTLGRMKGFNVLLGQADSRLQRFGNLPGCRFHLFRCHGQRRKTHRIKTLLQFQQRTVAFGPYLIDKGTDRIKQFFCIQCRTTQKVRPLICRWYID